MYLNGNNIGNYQWSAFSKFIKFSVKIFFEMKVSFRCELPLTGLRYSLTKYETYFNSDEQNYFA